MSLYTPRSVVIEALPFEPYMEDEHHYHIPMFGDFTKQECMDGGLIVDNDFENYPYQHSLVLTKDGLRAVGSNHMILFYEDGTKDIMLKEEFESRYELLNE